MENLKIEEQIKNLKIYLFDIIMEQRIYKEKLEVLEQTELKAIEELANWYKVLMSVQNQEKLNPNQEKESSGKVIPVDFTKKGNSDEEKKE